MTTNAVAAKYAAVAAGQSGAQLGATGAKGDLLEGILVVPASTSPGAITIQDGGGSAMTVFAGGASSLSNLVSFFVPLHLQALGAGWKITTGANLSVIAVGDFT